MRMKLGELFAISSGGTPSKSHPEYYNGGTINWVKTGDLKQRYLYNCEDCITKAGLQNSSARMYDIDTVLLAMYGATIGATSILKVPACTNQACAAFPVIDEVIPEYLYYFFLSRKKQFVKDGVGGAQPNISARYLKAIEIELQDLDMQKKIVSMLHRIETLIAFRKEQLTALDTLIKSRFVEMFEAKYPMISLGSEIKTTSGGTPSKKKEEYYFGGDIPWLTSGEVNLGFINSTQKFITQQGLDNSSAKWVPANSVVIAMYGATAGKVGVLKIPATTNQAVCVLLPNPEFETLYLYCACTYNEKWMLSKCVGVAQPNISQAIIKEMPISKPPIAIQKQFAAFVAQVEQSKAAVQQALDEAQMLFDSLMQQYFG